MPDAATPQEKLEALGESAVRERHIDFLLQEEFASNPQFLTEFLALCHSPQDAVVLASLSSVRDKTGETDVLVSYRLKSDDVAVRRVLLIEDKIDAVFAKRQAERYQDRGKQGIAAAKWTSYLTCLVAPRAYIHEGHGFNCAVALETISDLLAPDNPSRQGFKQAVIRFAVEEQARQGLKVEDTAVTEFRLKYFHAYQKFWSKSEDPRSSLLEDVVAEQPRRAWWDDTWFEFKGPGLGSRTYANHKAKLGAVDLTFKYTQADKLSESVAIEEGMTIVQTGKSAAIRLTVPSIDCHADFDAQAPKLRAAFVALLRLVAFFKSHPELRSQSEDQAVIHL